jgi:hypothetical protein
LKKKFKLDFSKIKFKWIGREEAGYGLQRWDKHSRVEGKPICVCQPTAAQRAKTAEKVHKTSLWGQFHQFEFNGFNAFI